MSEGERARQADDLIARMKAARGYIYPEWELAARQDPDFVEAYNRLYELGLGEGRHVATSDKPFGLGVYGYYNVGSYAYIGGSDIKIINPLGKPTR